MNPYYGPLLDITDEAFEAVVRAYQDVGLRVVLAPAVADVVFFQTVPGLLDLLHLPVQQVELAVARAGALPQLAEPRAQRPLARMRRRTMRSRAGVGSIISCARSRAIQAGRAGSRRRFMCVMKREPLAAKTKPAGVSRRQRSTASERGSR